jgi:hypothetical protein
MKTTRYATHEYGGYCQKPAVVNVSWQMFIENPEASISIVGIPRLLGPHTVVVELILYSAEVFDCFI